MSIIPPGLSRLLEFYLSGPLPCPYLPDRVERKLFTKLSHDTATDVEINSTLTRAGFRRSHDIVYRPACQSCSACVPVRVPVKAFNGSRTLRRIDRKNSDLIVSFDEAKADDELFTLFRSYQEARHPDSDMAQMSYDEFSFMLTEGQSKTFLLSLRTSDGQLIASLMTDTVNDGYSAVYSFYAPEFSHRSLGCQLIMSLITEAHRLNLPYVYLGYWIAASRKMAYKARFYPLQALGPQGWDWLELTENNR